VEEPGSDEDEDNEEGDGFGVPSSSLQTDGNDEDSNVFGH